jgi:hypothetical protein
MAQIRQSRAVLPIVNQKLPSSSRKHIGQGESVGQRTEPILVSRHYGRSLLPLGVITEGFVIERIAQPNHRFASDTFPIYMTFQGAL